MPGPYPLQTGIVLLFVIIFTIDWLYRRGQDERDENFRKWLEEQTREPDYYI